MGTFSSRKVWSARVVQQEITKRKAMSECIARSDGAGLQDDSKAYSISKKRSRKSCVHFEITEKLQNHGKWWKLEMIIVKMVVQI